MSYENRQKRVKVLFRVPREDGGEEVESLWAIPVEDGYQLDNIPFCASSIACGDIVATKSNDDGALEFESLVQESGHSTDVDAPGKILFMDESPILLGSSKQLAGLVSGAGQFVSGVFLAFHVGDVPRFRSVIGTEDKQGASLCNALVEFRTIDTSWIEITSISREILLHAFSRYEMIKISEL